MRSTRSTPQEKGELVRNRRGGTQDTIAHGYGLIRTCISLVPVTLLPYPVHGTLYEHTTRVTAPSLARPTRDWDFALWRSAARRAFGFPDPTAQAAQHRATGYFSVGLSR